MAHVLWLTAVWAALWGSLTVGTLLGGVLVGTVLVLAFPRRPSPLGWSFRLLPFLRFALDFLGRFLVANAVVAWEVITPNNAETVNEAFVAVPLTGVSDGIVTLVANAISLTPGTLTVEVERHPTVLYIHVLHLRDVEHVRSEVLKMELLAVRAFGSREAIEQAELHRRERDLTEGPQR